jgi:hypothetical protein
MIISVVRSPGHGNASPVNAKVAAKERARLSLAARRGSAAHAVLQDTKAAMIFNGTFDSLDR